MNYKRLLPCYFPAVLSLVLALCWPCATGAQTAYTEATKAKLNVSVHLALPDTTLTDVLAALSAQTGVVIEAADALKQRRLSLQMQGLRAADALDTLTEMYGWRWFEPTPNHVLVARQKPRPVEKQQDIPPALKAAMPVDFIRFLGMDNVNKPIPTEGLKTLTDTLRQQIKDSHSGWNNGYSLLMMNSLNKYAADQFLWLEPGLFTRPQLPFKQLTRAQQDTVVGYFVLYILIAAN